MIGFVLAAVLATSFTGPDGDWLVDNRMPGPIVCRYGADSGRMRESQIRVEQGDCRAVPMTAGGISCDAAYSTYPEDRADLLIEARPVNDWVEIATHPRMRDARACAKAVTIREAAGSRGEVHAYNSAELPGWCADKPGPKKDGTPIPADGGWRTFPVRPAWCSPGVVIETPEEHKAHGTQGHCPKEAAMWDVAMRKTAREFRRKQEAK